jgi:acyl-CoA synthetase (AMP-forming)/AMP-acid ligase II
MGGDFLRSDDIGVLEKDGRLRIIDRGNGLIISGGENVYAAEVERVLISHPQVRDVTVSGKPDPRWGEVVVAVVVPKPGTSRPRLACLADPRHERGPVGPAEPQHGTVRVLAVPHRDRAREVASDLHAGSAVATAVAVSSVASGCPRKTACA